MLTVEFHTDLSLVQINLQTWIGKYSTTHTGHSD